MILQPRERVRRAIEHRETDRVPVDYWATIDVDRKLCEYFKLKYEVPTVPDSARCALGNAQATPESLLELLGIDLRKIDVPYAGPPLRSLSDGRIINVWGQPLSDRCSWGMPQTTWTYSSAFPRPLAKFTKPSQLDMYQWPNPDWWNYSTIEEQCERYAEYGLGFQGDWAPLFCQACCLFGMERFLILMHTNPELAHATVDRISDFWVQFIKNILENGGDKADIFCTWDDVAHKDNLFMSLKMWREYFEPHLRDIYNPIKKYGLRIMQHTCGAIKPLIPKYIELGMDILNPIDVRAAGMNPRELKEDFGGKITFHGAVDVQHTLPYGTPEEVRKEVHERIMVLGNAGGYIMTSSHVLLPDIPVENILAMYREAGSIT